MKNLMYLLRCVLCAAFCVFCLPFACIAAGEESEEEEVEKEEFDERTRGASYFTQEEETLSPELMEEDVEEESTREVTESHEGRDVQATYACKVHQYKASPGYDELFLLNPTHDIIYPGSVIDGASVVDGRYVPIIAPRRPLPISVSILGVNEQASSLAERVSLSGVRDAIQPLLHLSNTEGLSPAANSVFSVQELHNETHFGLALGVNIKAQVTPTFRVGLGASFSLDTRDERHHYMARYAHRYFTVDIDLPSNPSDFFESMPYINDPRVSPVYISSVTYGRMILFSLKTNKSSTEISAALNASLEIADRLDINAELSTNHREALESAEIASTVIGGSGSVCNGVDSIAKLGRCVSEGGLTYQDAVPIAYTMRFLKDNSVARIVMANTYTVRECSLTSIDSSDTARFHLKRLRSSNNDGGSNSLDIYGNVGIAATDEEPGNKGNCGGSQLFHHHTMIFGRHSYENIDVGGSWLDVTNSNYRGSILLSYEKPNISVCARLFDRDSSSSDERIRGRHVFSDSDFSPEDDGQNPRVIRFGSNNWVDIELRKE